MARDADVVEEDLPLVQGALTQLVQRLAPGDSRQVERDDSHARPRHTHRRLNAEEDQGVSGYRTVGYPGRLLAANDPLVAGRAFGEVLGRRLSLDRPAVPADNADAAGHALDLHRCLRGPAPEQEVDSPPPYAKAPYLHAL